MIFYTFCRFYFKFSLIQIRYLSNLSLIYYFDYTLYQSEWRSKINYIQL